MYKQKFVLENEIQRILWDFKIQTDHLTPSDNLQKKSPRQFEMPVHVDHWVKIKESKKIDKYLELDRTKKWE